LKLHLGCFERISAVLVFESGKVSAVMGFDPNELSVIEIDLINQERLLF
jgi:hypothetical protein